MRLRADRTGIASGATDPRQDCRSEDPSSSNLKFSIFISEADVTDWKVSSFRTARDPTHATRVTYYLAYVLKSILDCV